MAATRATTPTARARALEETPSTRHRTAPRRQVDRCNSLRYFCYMPTSTNTPADFGFLGPDSVTWRLFSHPSSFTIGFLRTVVVEMFDPFLLASVSDTGAVEERTSSRYDRTLQYVATAAFADSERAVRAADVLYRIHERVRGIEPVSGLPFEANDPDRQLWIHLTQWQSILLCYELVGPGRLSAADDARYWAEGRIVAELQTIDPATVPASRDEMRAYYERVRPRLAITEDTRRIVRHLLAAPGSFGLPGSRATAPVVRAATVATLPRWLQQLAGIDQPTVVGAAALAATKAALRALERDEHRVLEMLSELSPGAHEVFAPRILRVDPVDAVVRTPAEAFATAGLIAPRQRYLDDADHAPDAPSAPRDAGVDQLLALS